MKTRSQQFDEAEALIRQQEMKISKEIQFTDWLFHKLQDILVPLGFVVEPECENKCVLPIVSEYSTSISFTTTMRIATTL